MLVRERGGLADHSFAGGGVALLQFFVGQHQIDFVCAVVQGLPRLRQHAVKRLVPTGEIDDGRHADAQTFRQPLAGLGDKLRIHAHGSRFADGLLSVVAEGVDNGGGVAVVERGEVEQGEDFGFWDMGIPFEYSLGGAKRFQAETFSECRLWVHFCALRCHDRHT